MIISLHLYLAKGPYASFKLVYCQNGSKNVIYRWIMPLLWGAWLLYLGILELLLPPGKGWIFITPVMSALAVFNIS